MTESQRAWRDLRRDIIDTTAEQLRARGVTGTATAVAEIRAALDKMPTLVGVRLSHPRRRRSA